MVQFLNYLTGNTPLTYLTSTYSFRFLLNEFSGTFYAFVTYLFLLMIHENTFFPIIHLNYK